MRTVPSELHDRKGPGFPFAFPAYDVRIVRAGSVLLSLLLISLLLIPFVPFGARVFLCQVHRARLLDGTEVAMKIQYPGVADSVESDLKNLQRLVQLTNILPPGLYIDEIIEVNEVNTTHFLVCSLKLKMYTTLSGNVKTGWVYTYWYALRRVTVLLNTRYY